MNEKNKINYKALYRIKAFTLAIIAACALSAYKGDDDSATEYDEANLNSDFSSFHDEKHSKTDFYYSSLSGEYGEVTIMTGVTDIFFDGAMSVNQSADRFSKDNNLVATLNITTSLDNMKQTIIFLPMGIKYDSAKDWEILIFLDKDGDDVYFHGIIGTEYTGIFKMDLDTYAIMLSRMYKFYDIDSNFNVDRVIDTLRDSENSEIQKWIEMWDSNINTPKEDFDYIRGPQKKI